MVMEKLASSTTALGMRGFFKFLINNQLFISTVDFPFLYLIRGQCNIRIFCHSMKGSEVEAGTQIVPVTSFDGSQWHEVRPTPAPSYWHEVVKGSIYHDYTPVGEDKLVTQHKN